MDAKGKIEVVYIFSVGQVQLQVYGIIQNIHMVFNILVEFISVNEMEYHSIYTLPHVEIIPKVAHHSAITYKIYHI
jgi:hypothetical protein